ncbi:hypothetical protein FACS1894187_22330 [Synergistales bacterium]|nr:hypothetical protein FACS1894187_22330 [Synergistales bacterium]
MTKDIPSPEAVDLLKDAFDMHVHTDPGLIKRKLNDFDLANELLEYGMSGAVIKAHCSSTANRAWLTNKHIGRDMLFGSIVLNHNVGGLNPYAVETELRLGGKIVWMPTIHAENHIKVFGGAGFNKNQDKTRKEEAIKGITIVDEHGKIREEVHQILDLISTHDACLATGHLSNTEAILLCKEALSRGVKKIQFTHPDFTTSLLPNDKQRELAEQGVIMEKTYVSVTWGCVSADQMAESIKVVGVERCIIDSDFGQPENPDPPVGLALFIDTLIDRGFKKEAVKRLVNENPKYILNI